MCGESLRWAEGVLERVVRFDAFVGKSRATGMSRGGPTPIPVLERPVRALQLPLDRVVRSSTG